MKEQIGIFHFDEDKPNFEALSNDNGFVYWNARELMYRLGYTSWDSFNKSIKRAISTCTNIDADIMSNFVQYRNKTGEVDYKLSRFACYLVVMNANPSHKEVARAQAYFATIAESFRRYIENQEDVERISDQEELKAQGRILRNAASKAGVEGNNGFALFHDAGYLGMYNMKLSELKAMRSLPDKRIPMDFMGAEELAANRFRLTQTATKLKNKNIQGQKNAEKAANEVGKTVRDTMISISGNKPENLPVYDDINKVKTSIRSTGRSFAKLDKKKKPPT